MKVRKAVFPAGGFGTRFLPATACLPKELIPAFDKPAIQIVAEEAVASGLDEIVVVTGRRKSAVEALFRPNEELEAFLRSKGRGDLLALLETPITRARLTVALQEEPRGLGHAVLCARAAVGDEPFVVFLADDIIDSKVPAARQLLDVRDRRGGAVVALQRIPRERIGGYGVVAGEEVEPGVWRVRDVVEKPRPEDAPSDLAIVGRYVLEPSIFGLLERTPPGRGGEIQLTDALRALVRDGTTPLWGVVFSGRRYDAGDPAGLLEAAVGRGLRSAEGPEIRDRLRRLLDEA